MSPNLLRRLAAEFIGTFGIVFAPLALAGAKSMPGADSSLLAAAFVSGFAVTAMIAAFGPICAAHFNPAVTLGFAAAGRFPSRLVPAYWASQAAGAAIAAGTCALLFGPGHGAHIPAIPPAKAMAVEALLTGILMLVIMAVATDKRVDGALPALSIGLTVVLCVTIGGALTGGSMNPARSLGPALFNASAMASWWIYLIGPCIGAATAARLFELVRIDRDFAQSAPNEIYDALEELAQADPSPAS